MLVPTSNDMCQSSILIKATAVRETSGRTHIARSSGGGGSLVINFAEQIQRGRDGSITKDRVGVFSECVRVCDQISKLDRRRCRTAGRGGHGKTEGVEEREG